MGVWSGAKGFLSSLLIWIFIGMLGLQGAMLGRYALGLVPYALTAQGRRTFLIQRERSFAASVWASGFTKANDRILSQEIRVFYFQSEMTREDAFRKESGYLKKFETPEVRLQFLKREQFTHLLTLDSHSWGVVPHLLEEWGFHEIPEKSLKLLGEKIVVYDGLKIRYQLYQIINP